MINPRFLVAPPHGNGVTRNTPERLVANDLIEELMARGCHQTDIGDAFYEADEAWVLKIEAGDDS